MSGCMCWVHLLQAVISRLLVHPNIVLTYDMCTGHMDAAKLKVCTWPLLYQSRKGRETSTAPDVATHHKLLFLVLCLLCWNQLVPLECPVCRCQAAQASP
jgi:hypothetical protein